MGAVACREVLPRRQNLHPSAMGRHQRGTGNAPNGTKWVEAVIDNVFLSLFRFGWTAS